MFCTENNFLKVNITQCHIDLELNIKNKIMISKPTNEHSSQHPEMLNCTPQGIQLLLHLLANDRD